MDSFCTDGDWVAVHVRLNRERFVGHMLDEYGYEQFVPVVKPARTTGHKRERVLLPGYVLCRYQTHPNHLIVRIPGVLGLVGVAGRPLAIPVDEVETFRRIVDSGVAAEPWRFIKEGSHVEVCSGPLSGVRGLVLYVKKGLRLVVSATIMRRSVAIELRADEVRQIQYGGQACLS
jgi:transcription antitermination factor NusG